MIYSFLSAEAAPSEIYPLSLHDALPILHGARLHLRLPGEVLLARVGHARGQLVELRERTTGVFDLAGPGRRSEEHTSELQSQSNLVCRLLLEKKKDTNLRVRPRVACGVG